MNGYGIHNTRRSWDRLFGFIMLVMNMIVSMDEWQSIERQGRLKFEV